MGTKGGQQAFRATGLPAILTVVVLVLAVLAAGFMGDFSAEPVLELPIATPQQETFPVPSASGTPEPLPDDGGRISIDGGTAVAALLILVMAGLALLVRFVLRFRTQQVSEEGVLHQTALQQQGTLTLVADTLPSWTESSSAALMAGTDTSDAVIRCWLDFERLCAAAGVGRRPTQTTSDFAAAVSARLDLPAQPLATLNRLYQRARFGGAGGGRSPERLGPADRDAAAASISALSHALASRGERAGTDR